jgi:hypothetical protein
MRQSLYGKFCYAAGIITAALVCLALSVFMKHCVMPQGLLPPAKSTPAPDTKETIYLPADILAELVQLRGTVDNAGNLTQQEPRNTVLVKPDAEAGYLIRPNVTINEYMLKSQTGLNFWTPALYIDAASKVSDKLEKYLAEQTRLKVSISTDENGFRKTLPLVKAEKKILIVGDNVAFGLCVNDEDTVASYLQRMVGTRYQIINAAVGGYDGDQVFKTVKRLSAGDEFSCLVYVAYQNDFQLPGGAAGVLERIRGLSDKFKGNVVTCFQTSLMYCAPDVFPRFLARNEVSRLREEFKTAAGALGFSYCDWVGMTDVFQAGRKSLFAKLSLYNDHCQLSPQGNELLAWGLFKRLQGLKLID